MQQFDISVPSTGSFVVHAAGRYLKYLSGNNGGGDTSLIVTPGGQGGNKIVLQPGQAYRVSDQGTKPDSWTLANSAGGATITGKVVVGDGRIDDNSLQGVVSTVDGGKARTLNNSAFGIVGVVNAVAAQYGRIQLWNPPGSGKRVVVESIAIIAGGGGAVGAFMQFNTVQLATLYSGGLSKLSGGVASVASCYTDTTATPASGSGESSLIAPAPQAYALKFSEPLIVTPGYGLVMYGGTINVLMQGNFEWYEEPNV